MHDTRLTQTSTCPVFISPSRRVPSRMRCCHMVVTGGECSKRDVWQRRLVWQDHSLLRAMPLVSFSFFDIWIFFAYVFILISFCLLILVLTVLGYRRCVFGCKECVLWWISFILVLEVGSPILSAVSVAYGFWRSPTSATFRPLPPPAFPRPHFGLHSPFPESSRAPEADVYDGFWPETTYRLPASGVSEEHVS